MKKTSRFASLALAVMGMAGLISTPAFASGTTLKVNQVECFKNGMYIQLSDGVNYQAYITAPSGCTAYNTTADTLKAWQSVGQAALLSGHAVTIYFATCNGGSYIQDMVLTLG